LGWWSLRSLPQATGSRTAPQGMTTQRTALSRYGSRNPRPSKPVLDAVASASERDRLVSEISMLDARDAAINWASRNLDAKNTLVATDAASVEDAFGEKMRVLQPDVYPLVAVPAQEPNPGKKPLPDPEPVGTGQPAREKHKQPRSHGSAMRLESMTSTSFVKPHRARERDHLRFICKQPCTVCGRTPCEAHHLRYAQPRAMGRRVSDEFTVPLCRLHHRELHQVGNELSWWKGLNLDPLPIAVRFWQLTRGVLPPAREGAKPVPQMPAAPSELQEGSASPSSNARAASYEEDGSAIA
jgi:hypothetical protein